jgi:hypothetical protein
MKQRLGSKRDINLLDEEEKRREKRKEQIQFEKEEIHEFFEQVRSENRKKSNRNLNQSNFNSYNLHKLVRSYKHEASILDSID